MHALPRRDREGGAADAATGLGQGTARPVEPGDARCVDLRPRSGRLQSADISDQVFSGRLSSAASRRIGGPGRANFDEDSNEQPSELRPDDQVRARRAASRSAGRRNHLAGRQASGHRDPASLLFARA
ncbi:hypothetical protein chiPu_0033753 [Chiloscyllium punctatum]|uniref:Uncharacterized protein n=1 Tax=Chiloscyllium punctatum TaxID=137246 RepID=A0A401U3R3_CHIPU|nr:hypothetical protein [Chiloscyllium punctatum]